MKYNGQQGTARTFGHRSCTLTPDAQRLFEALRAEHGPTRLAALLGVSPPVIAALDFGGKAKPETVAKVTAAIAELTSKGAA